MEADKIMELCNRMYELDKKLYDFILKMRSDLDHIIYKQDGQIEALALQTKLNKRIICEEHGGHFFKESEEVVPINSMFNRCRICSVCNYIERELNPDW